MTRQCHLRWAPGGIRGEEKAGFGAQPRERGAILASRSHDTAIVDDDGPPESYSVPDSGPQGPQAPKGEGEFKKIPDPGFPFICRYY